MQNTMNRLIDNRLLKLQTMGKLMLIATVVLFSMENRYFKVTASSERPDFPTILRSKYFVDKTLLIKDLLVDGEEDKNSKIITAPTGFGKTTIIDMVKRFVGVNTNEKGEVLSATDSDNFKLFCDTPLQICKDETFVNLHFGQYPVIHIDYSPLKGMINFDTLILRFRTVIQTSFAQHKYLKENSTLWTDQLEKDAFNRFCDETDDGKLSADDVLYSFEILSELLHRHFGKDALVLIDEFDGYQNSLLFKNIQHAGRVRKFYRKFHEGLLKINQFVDRALLTGVSRKAVISMCPKNVGEYTFPNSHKFSKYYGFSVKDIEHVVKNSIGDEHEREIVKSAITNNCDGYVVEGGSDKVYSISSVVNYFETH